MLLCSLLGIVVVDQVVTVKPEGSDYADFVGDGLGTLGGLIAATQVFYLPVFIAVYQFQPSLLPLTIGLLGGAHFLPYAWLYNSRGYLFVALATGLSALILGGPFMASSLTLVPLAIALTYALGTLWILRENRKQ